MNKTPVRIKEGRQRKNTEMSTYSQIKQNSAQKPGKLKKKVKVRQITFKKDNTKKFMNNKNFSEMSTASNKASKEFILRSFMSNESKKTKQSGKKRDNSKGKHNESLGVIKEERKKAKRRISNSLTLQKNSKFQDSNSSGFKLLNKQTMIKDGYLATVDPNAASQRPSI